MRSAVKNRVHAILAKHGIANEHSDLFGKGGREFLETLQLRDAPRRRLDSLMSLICDFDREIETTTREIEERAKADDRVDVLSQIRGVGRYTAMLIIAEIGDIHRFPTARHLCSWAGLAPSVRSSRRQSAPTGTSPAKAHPRCAGRWSRPRRRSPPDPGPCETSSNGSRSAAGARSRKSLSPARS